MDQSNATVYRGSGGQAGTSRPKSKDDAVGRRLWHFTYYSFSSSFRLVTVSLILYLVSKDPPVAGLGRVRLFFLHLEAEVGGVPVRGLSQVAEVEEVGLGR